MIFKRELPQHNGYFWYIDIDYPIPKIGFWDNYKKELFQLCSGLITFNNVYYPRHIQFGDEIVQPERKENQYETN